MAEARLRSTINRLVDEHTTRASMIRTRSSYHAAANEFRKRIDDAITEFAEAHADHITQTAEQAFRDKYGQDSATVRQQYIDLLEANSRNDSRQHTVLVDGYNAKGAHHLGLKPESYSFCKPDDRIKAAFAVVGARCKIEPEPHFEHWGN